jgi:hypothetical protein
MREENKDSKADWANWNFVLATLLTAPFVLMLLSEVEMISPTFPIPQFVVNAGGFLLFEWPFSMSAGPLGLIFIFIAWLRIPKFRALLIFYALIIIGFFAWVIIDLLLFTVHHSRQ